VSSALEAFTAARPDHGLPREHLSPAAIGTFARCPEQFRRRYLLGQKERPAAAMLWGSADHKAHERNFRQKIDSYEDISEDDVKLAFAEEFDQGIDAFGGLAEITWKEDEKPGDIKDRGVALVGAYHRTVSPTIQPRGVEEKIVHEVAGIPVPIIGYIDLRAVPAGAMASGSALERIIDGKTAARAEKNVKPQWRMQGRIYQAATGLPVEWHVKAKGKLPAVYTAQTDPGLRMEWSRKAVEATERRLRGLVSQLLHMIATFGPDEPWPSSAPDSWSNVCGYCGFRPTCAWWAE
jgi:RecB family exonuclease